MNHGDQVSDGSGEVGAARITSEVLEVMIKVTPLQDHNDEDEGDDDEQTRDSLPLLAPPLRNPDLVLRTYKC